MNAIVVDQPGDATQMRLAEVPDPVPGDSDVLLRVHASALNRADINQRQGNYPPRPGTSEILGLELAGEVIGAGASVTKFKEGDRVYGLSGGGGYGEIATLHEDLAMPIPDAFDWQYAASIPEVFFTANTAIRTLGRLQDGERVLIHAGGSGVGIAATQIAKLIGAEVWITAGSDEKCTRSADLGGSVGGADITINYKTDDFAEEVKNRTDGKGVNVILDVVGADYLQRNLDSLAYEGRLVLVSLLSGAQTDVNIGRVLRNRLQILGTVMRNRPHEARAGITRDFQANLEPALVDGRMKSVIDRVFPLREAADAHRYMEANQNFGKIVLDVANGC